jgi:carboxypeptidase C (cathepsin A)
MAADGALPPPPYELEDNPHTWLAFTDLVFIDPVGTGYSRAASPEIGRKFWSVNGDIESVGEFIRLYLTRNERWLSPLFLVGESYGTTRAAGLAGHLANRGISFNGVVLVSSILQFQTARFTPGNDLPYSLFLPTYSAIAWYHKKLPADLLQLPVARLMDEVKAWAGTEYTVALARGDRLTAAERQAVAQRLARYTGLSAAYVEQADLRPEIQRFCRELLRDQGLTVGRLDGRFSGRGGKGTDATPEFDPSMTAIRPPYTATFAHYVRAELGFQSDAVYHILGGGIGPWDHQSNNAFAETADALRSAFAKNPYMRVLVASGYYDLATPFFATEYTLAHMGLDPEARTQVQVTEYESGHMMYIHEPSLAEFTRDASTFVAGATARTPPRPVARSGR